MSDAPPTEMRDASSHRDNTVPSSRAPAHCSCACACTAAATTSQAEVESDDVFHVIVGDRRFAVSKEALLTADRHKDTMLGGILEHESDIKSASLVFLNRSSAVFEAVLAYLSGGPYPYEVRGVSPRQLYFDLDFWGIFPQIHSIRQPAADADNSDALAAAADMVEQSVAGVSLVSEAIRQCRPAILSRLQCGYLSHIRFVTPTYTVQPIQETENLVLFLQTLVADAANGTPLPDNAFSIAVAHWADWTLSEAYARSILRGVERFLPSDMHAVVSPVVALAAASTAARVYAASALMTHGKKAQHELARELARSDLHVHFHVTVWPEDISSDIDASIVSNPYEDCPDLGYGAMIVKLWGYKLHSHPEPAVWKVGIASEDRERLQQSGIHAKKGVAYLLIDVSLLT